MEIAPDLLEGWRRPVAPEAYGEMAPDDESFLRLTGLVRLRYAARRLAVSADDLRGRLAAGRLRGQKIGSAWYVSESELDRYVQRRSARRPGLRRFG
jgi:hypothetical protein